MSNYYRHIQSVKISSTRLYLIISGSHFVTGNLDVKLLETRDIKSLYWFKTFPHLRGNLLDGKYQNILILFRYKKTYIIYASVVTTLVIICFEHNFVSYVINLSMF